MKAPMDVATVRCRLASCLEMEGDQEAAALEFAAARNTLQQAGADGLLLMCEQLARAFGDRRRPPRPTSRPTAGARRTLDAEPRTDRSA